MCRVEIESMTTPGALARLSGRLRDGLPAVLWLTRHDCEALLDSRATAAGLVALLATFA